MRFFLICAAVVALGLSVVLNSPLRAQAVDEATCKAVAADLASPSADGRERAARRLYEHCDRAVLDTVPGMAATLGQAVERGSGAAAILLLGHFRDAESLRILRSVASAKPVKLRLSSVPVPASLVAAVALAHAGQPARLEAAVRTSILGERVFLLDVLGEFEPGPAMTMLADQTLGDEREVAGGLPSGAQPRRRLCDAAVDAFVTRLNPKLSFSITPARRYSTEQLVEARTGIRERLAR